MTNDRVRSGLERWAGWVVRHRVTVLLAAIAVVGGLATGLPRLRLETSFETYLPESDPARVVYDAFRDEFGSDERVVVLLQPSSLYDETFLRELEALHEALEQEVPFVDEVTSLVNARHLVGTRDALISEPLLDRIPGTPAEVERLRARVRSNPLYRNWIVSADERATALIVELDGTLTDDAAALTGAELLAGFDDTADVAPPEPIGRLLSTAQAAAVREAIADVIAARAPAGTRVSVAGTPLLADRLGILLTDDIVRFVAISAGLTALLLFALFRSVRGILPPLVVVAAAVVGTLGWMGLADWPITAVTEILPSLLLAIGVADSIHLQSAFHQLREEGLDVDTAIRRALGRTGIALVLTSLTTAGSMLAFRTAHLQPVIDLGRAAPVGIALALLLTFTVHPALLSFWTGASSRRRQATTAALDTGLIALSRTGTRHPRAVVVTTVVLSLVALAHAMTLRFSQDDLRWLAADDPLRRATETLNDTMGGMEPFELVLRADPGTDWRDPPAMNALREIEERARALRRGPVSIAQSISLVDVLDETHRAITGDEALTPAATTRALVGQELLLFESAAPDDLAELVSGDWRTTRIAMTAPFVDALYYPRFADAVVAEAHDVIDRAGLAGRVEVRPTGLLVLAGETFRSLLGSMLRSYAVAFAVIATLMALLIRDWRLGLLAAVPNLSPIVIVLGIMAWLDAPIDISTMLVGGILIGVVVDDTIHMIHRFGDRRHVTGCSVRSIRETVASTGRAVVVTSVVLATGFFAFLGASLSNVAQFGLFCGIGVVLALVADLVLLPALISLAAPCPPDCACRSA